MGKLIKTNNKKIPMCAMHYVPDATYGAIDNADVDDFMKVFIQWGHKVLRTRKPTLKNHAWICIDGGQLLVCNKDWIVCNKGNLEIISDYVFANRYQIDISKKAPQSFSVIIKKKKTNRVKKPLTSPGCHISKSVTEGQPLPSEVPSAIQYVTGVSVNHVNTFLLKVGKYVPDVLYANKTMVDGMLYIITNGIHKMYVNPRDWIVYTTNKRIEVMTNEQFISKFKINPDKRNVGLKVDDSVKPSLPLINTYMAI